MKAGFEIFRNGSNLFKEVIKSPYWGFLLAGKGKRGHSMITHTEIQRGSIVQFKSDWDTYPTPGNTSIVTRVAKNRTWADVQTPFGRKRIPYPDRNLKLVTKPLLVQIEGE